MKNSFKIFSNGLLTGLFLQLAIGPVFFFIINLAFQKTIYDGLVAVLAVTLVDYIYITLSVTGIGKILENKKTKRLFGAISSIVLIAFGVVIINGILGSGLSTNTEIESGNLVSSFISAFVLTISNPMTIIFFTGIFASKAIERNYTKKNLYIFGFSVGLATMIFMGVSVILFSLLRETIPMYVIQILNLIVGFVLISYGALRFIKILKKK